MGKIGRTDKIWFAYFPNELNETYRLEVYPLKCGYEIWLESKSHQQWKLEIEDFAHYGTTEHIPNHVVLNNFKNGIFKLQDEKNFEVEKATGPFVDLLHTIEGMSILLDFNIHLGWDAKYKFDLFPVVMDKTNRLESRLRDAFKEIEYLKEQICLLCNKMLMIFQICLLRRRLTMKKK